MKNFIFYAFALLLFASCQSTDSDPALERFIPGTYVRFSQHEFGKEFDTIQISVQNANGKEYQIERRWRYERVIDGVSVEPEYKITVTTGFYHSGQEWLTENETGQQYSFNRKQDILLIGSTKYQRL